MSDSDKHEVEDPVELMLKRTGCIELHYKVQMCVMRKILSLVNGKPMKMVLVVRADLKLSKGKTGSQCAHAAVMCYHNSMKLKPDLCSSWFHQGQPKIVLRVDNLDELKELETQAKKVDVMTAIVRDAGRTEIACGTTTVLGLGPDTSEKIDTIVKHLKLL
uniref:peptidyl-tRNA hydrolase n=1 Tax=Culicoides sonorensis TaxID=179676 RepID=A0A336LKH5_CULSO